MHHRITFPFLIAACILPHLAQAQTNDPWRLLLTPYYWAFSSDGRVTLNGEEFEFSPGYMDDSGSFKPSSFGMGIDLYNDRWGILLNGEHYVADTDRISAALADRFKEVSVSDTVVDLMGQRQFFFEPFGRELELTPHFGVRYRNFQLRGQTVEEEPRAVGDTEISWAPVGGGLLEWKWSDRWSAVVRGYASGFGIEDAPEVDWTVATGLRYHWTQEFYLMLGYRWQEREWEYDTAAGKMGFDGSYEGLLFSIGLDMSVQEPPLYVPPSEHEALLDDAARYITPGLIEEVPPDADPKKYRFRRWLNKTHRRINKELHRWVNDLDTIMEARDRPRLIPEETSRIYFGLDFELRESNREGTEFDMKPTIDTKLKLPNLERDLKLVIDSRAVNETPGTDSFDEERGLSLGLETDKFVFKKVKASVRLRSTSTSLAEIELRAAWVPKLQKGKWLLAPKVMPYYRSDQGFGTRAEFYFQYGAFDRGRIGYLPGIHWSEELNTTEWYHNFAGIYLFEGTEFDFHRAFTSFLTIRGDVDLNATEYRWEPLTYRAPLYGKWLYYSVGPQFRWTREDDWEMEPSLRLYLEALFFGMKDR